MADDSQGNKPNRPLRPRQAGAGGRRKRRVVIDTRRRPPAARPAAAARSRRRREPKTDAAGRSADRPGRPSPSPASTVKDFSQALGVTMAEIIKILMALGQMQTATQSL